MADDTRLADACLLLNYSTQSYSNCTNNVNNDDNKDQKYFETTTNREPIHNLLAAVNCALPGIRSTRPTILQRSATNQATKTSLHNNICSTTNSSNNLSDHDYCQHDDNNSPKSKLSLNNPHMNDLTSITNCVGLESDISGVDLEFANLDNNNPTYDLKSSSGSFSKRKQLHSKSSSFDSLYTTTNTITKKPLKLVAVHLGAGNSQNEIESMQLAKSICEEIMLQLPSTSDILNVNSKMGKRRKVSINSSNNDNNNQKETSSLNDLSSNTHDNKHQAITAELAVVQLIKRMEDNSSLNCGYGSNLNIKGQVECDASLMCDKSQMWAGIGAVSGCRNPILLAKSLYDSRATPRPLGLVQPNLLVGSGAKQWMREHCPHLSVMDSKLVSSKALTTYQKLKSRYDCIVRSSSQQSFSNFSKLKLTQQSKKNLTPLKTNNDDDDDIIVHNKKQNNDPNTNTALVKRIDTNYEPSMVDDGQIDVAYLLSESENLVENNANKNDNGNNNNQQAAATSLDHGFYCIKTGNNLKSVPSFARATSKTNDDTTYKLAIDNDNNSDDTNEYLNETQIDFQQFLHETHEENDDECEFKLDTVGAIAVDCDNNFASAISSGGLLLKYKGRIGQAAVPGAGCWSEDSVAVTTTGVGEYLTLNMFARKFYEKMLTLRLLFDLGHIDEKADLSGLISCIINECFEDLMKTPALGHVAREERLAGMLSVSTLNSKDSLCSRADEKDLYLSYAHNTKSMCIGYMTCNDIVGHSLMSRRMEKQQQQQDSSIQQTTDQINVESTQQQQQQQPTTLVKTLKFSLDLNKPCC